MFDHPFIRNALGGGGSPNVLCAFSHITLALGLSYVQIFVSLVARLLTCLFASFLSVKSLDFCLSSFRV